MLGRTHTRSQNTFLEFHVLETILENLPDMLGKFDGARKCSEKNQSFAWGIATTLLLGILWTFRFLFWQGVADTLRRFALWVHGARAGLWTKLNKGASGGCGKLRVPMYGSSKQKIASAMPNDMKLFFIKVKDLVHCTTCQACPMLMTITTEDNTKGNYWHGGGLCWIILFVAMLLSSDVPPMSGELLLKFCAISWNGLCGFVFWNLCTSHLFHFFTCTLCYETRQACAFCCRSNWEENKHSLAKIAEESLSANCGSWSAMPWLCQLWQSSWREHCTRLAWSFPPIQS